MCIKCNLHIYISLIEAELSSLEKNEIIQQGGINIKNQTPEGIKYNLIY